MPQKDHILQAKFVYRTLQAAMTPFSASYFRTHGFPLANLTGTNYSRRPSYNNTPPPPDADFDPETLKKQINSFLQETHDRLLVGNNVVLLSAYRPKRTLDPIQKKSCSPLETRLASWRSPQTLHPPPVGILDPSPCYHMLRHAPSSAPTSQCHRSVILPFQPATYQTPTLQPRIPCCFDLVVPIAHNL